MFSCFLLNPKVCVFLVNSLKCIIGTGSVSLQKVEVFMLFYMMETQQFLCVDMY